MGPSTQCHRCGGWGQLARDCGITLGKSKGKGKDTFGGNYKGADHQKGKSKGNSKGVGKGMRNRWPQGARMLESGQYPYYQRQISKTAAPKILMLGAFG